MLDLVDVQVVRWNKGGTGLADDYTFFYGSDAQPVVRGTTVCRRGHLGVPRNFRLSL
jgi:hypothetical protein